MRTKKVTELLAVLSWTQDRCLEELAKARWPDGPACHHCGSPNPYSITRRTSTKNKVGKLYKCSSCSKQFSVTTGTIFEGSKVPLNKWFAAIYFICESNGGVNANKLHRALQISYPSAARMFELIDEAIENTDSSILKEALIKATDDIAVRGKTKRNLSDWIANRRILDLYMSMSSNDLEISAD